MFRTCPINWAQYVYVVVDRGNNNIICCIVYYFIFYACPFLLVFVLCFDFAFSYCKQYKGDLTKLGFCGMIKVGAVGLFLGSKDSMV